MRKARIQQLPLAEATTDHPKAKELAKISEILNNNSSIYDLVLQDLGDPDNNETGQSSEEFRGQYIQPLLSDHVDV